MKKVAIIGAGIVGATAAYYLSKEKDIAGKLKTKYLIAPLPIYDTPLLLDKKLALNQNLVFSAGSFTESVKVPTKSYLKAVNPIIGQFSK